MKNKINLLLSYSLFALFWSIITITEASNRLLNPQITYTETISKSSYDLNTLSDRSEMIRISTAHFPPYIHKDNIDINGNMYNGMEFQLLQVMAKILHLNLQYQTISNHSDICFNHRTDPSAEICIGGIFPTQNILHNQSMSVTYESDDLTWCVPKAKMLPMFLAQALCAQPSVWFSVIFGYGYTCGFLLYLLVQFDGKYERRNSCDWHHTTWLVTLPAVIGMSPNFRPVKGTVRIFFVFVLITAFFLFQIFFTHAYEALHRQIPWHQVSSLNEILDRDFHLIGSLEAFNLLNQSKMIPQHKIESFNICGDINECLPQLLNQERLAIGGSRQNILNSPLYFPSQIFCFEHLENIASYPVALYMRKDFHLNEEVNSIIQRLLEAGFFVKWKSDSQSKRKHDEPYTIPLQLPVSHILFVVIFVLGCGSIMSTSAFVVEKFIYWKLKKPGGRLKIWIYLEQFFDGERHYLKNLPERLKDQRKTFEIENPFPYLE